MSNSLDPDQDRHSVGPDLGPNSLQTTKVATSIEKVYLLSCQPRVTVTSCFGLQSYQGLIIDIPLVY